VTSAAGGHERLYRGLLRLYPADYRAHYSDQMVQLFTDQRREVGTTRAWLRAPADVISTALGEHLRRNRTVAHSMTLAPTPAGRLLGLLGILGGGFLLMGYINLEAWTPELVTLRLVLFNLGAIAIAIGVHLRQADAGRLLSLSGAIPVVLSNVTYVAFLLLMFAEPWQLGGERTHPANLWEMSAVAMWLSNAWFGLVTLRLGVMNGWSAFTLMIGSIAAFAGMGYFGLAANGTLGETVKMTLMALHGLAWVLLGLELAFRRRPAPTASASEG